MYVYDNVNLWDVIDDVHGTLHNSLTILDDRHNGQWIMLLAVDNFCRFVECIALK